MRMLCWTIMLTFALVASQEAARGESITVAFTGVVTSVEDGLASHFAIGDAFSGYYIYETNGAYDTQPQPDEGQYWIIHDVSLNIGDHRWSSIGGYKSLHVLDRAADHPAFPLEESYAVSGQGFESSEHLAPSLYYWRISSGFHVGEDELDGDGVPVHVPFASSDYELTTLFGASATSLLGVSGEFYSLRVIPEPSTLALIGLSMAGLAWRRRRR